MVTRRAAGNTVFDLIGQRIEPQTFCFKSKEARSHSPTDYLYFLYDIYLNLLTYSHKILGLLLIFTAYFLLLPASTIIFLNICLRSSYGCLLFVTISPFFVHFQSSAKEFKHFSSSTGSLLYYYPFSFFFGSASNFLVDFFNLTFAYSHKLKKLLRPRYWRY